MHPELVVCKKCAAKECVRFKYKVWMPIALKVESRLVFIQLKVLEGANVYTKCVLFVYTDLKLLGSQF